MGLDNLIDLFLEQVKDRISRGFRESSEMEKVGHVAYIQAGPIQALQLKGVKGGEIVHVVGLTKTQPVEMMEFQSGVKGVPVRWGDDSIEVALIPPTVGADGTHQGGGDVLEGDQVKRTGELAPPSSFYLLEACPPPPCDFDYDPSLDSDSDS